MLLALDKKIEVERETVRGGRAANRFKSDSTRSTSLCSMSSNPLDSNEERAALGSPFHGICKNRVIVKMTE